MKQIFLFFIASIFSVVIYAQPNQGSEKPVRYTINMKGGSVYTGVIISDDGREMLVLTETVGKLYINKTDLVKMTKIEEKKEIEYNANFLTGGRYLDDGPFTTRYNVTTNALPIKKGENYAMTNLYGAEVHFALNNRLNVGIMTSWIASPLALAAKYSFPTKNPKLNFSVGTILMTSGFFENFQGYGHLSFGNVTLGDRLNNITLSGGYFSFIGPAHNPLVGPMGSLAGSFKLGPNTNFIFDSMFGYVDYKYTSLLKNGGDPTKLNTHTILISPGMRFQSTENFAWQLSLATVGLKEAAFPVPFLTLFKKF